MSQAIDHLTVISQHLHPMPLDTFPTNSSQFVPQTTSWVTLFMFCCWCLCLSCGCAVAPMNMIYSEDIYPAVFHTLCFYKKKDIQMFFLFVFFSYILLCLSIFSALVLHLPALFNLILNKNFTFLCRSPHFFCLLPFSWEHPVMVLDWFILAEVASPSLFASYCFPICLY